MKIRILTIEWNDVYASKIGKRIYVLSSEIVGISDIASAYTESGFDIILKSGECISICIGHNKQGEFDPMLVADILEKCREKLLNDWDATLC